MEELLSVREVVRMTGVSEKVLEPFGRNSLAIIAWRVNDDGGDCCAWYGWF